MDYKFAKLLRGGKRAPVLLAAACFLSCGCFGERSFSPGPRDLVTLNSIDVKSSRPQNARDWLRDEQARIAGLLPKDPPPLLTEDLTGLDRPQADIWRHFDRAPTGLDSVVTNYYGMIHSAQSGGRAYVKYDDRSPWPGFDDVKIPTADGQWVTGRMGWAKDDAGRIQDGVCVLLVPGIYGHSLTLRTRDLALGLREAGFHVLSIDPRGHGHTEDLRPDLAFTFGVIEVTDILAAADWAEKQPGVRATGLIGSSWGANMGLLAAWYANRSADDPDIRPELARRMPPIPPGRHLTAGVIAVSCIPRFEQVLDELESPRSMLANPGLNNVQGSVRRRMEEKGSADRSGSLRRLIAFEFSRSVLNYPEGVRDGLQFLRLTPYQGLPCGRKLEAARVPVLILHGSNDPLIHADQVLDLLRGVENPNVAAVMLSGGGHVGFLPYARQYTFNLIVDFLRFGAARAE